MSYKFLTLDFYLWYRNMEDVLSLVDIAGAYKR